MKDDVATGCFHRCWSVPFSAVSSELKLKTESVQMSQAQTRRALLSPGPYLNQDQTVHIKEEPEEESIEQKEEQLPVSAQRDETQEDISSEPHFHSQTKRVSVHASYTDHGDDWELFSSQTEPTPEENYNQFKIRDRNTAAQNSGLSPKCMSAPETSAAINATDMPGIDQGSEMKKQECPFCQKRFDCKMNLKRHIRVHTGERPYSCSICEKTFTYKGNLAAHSRVHTGERPYSCSICNNTFAHRFSLKEHMKTHTNEKPYSCTICEKTFAHKGNLTTHMRTHTNEKPYRCSLCDKSFALKNTLDIHTRQHTGEKPYRCSLCDKEFYQSSHLHKHMKRNHTNRSQS